MRVEAPEEWQAAVFASGAPELTLTATCPQCTTRLSWNVQPPPWSEPTDAEGAATFAGHDGHLADGFAGYEARRVRNGIAHRDADHLATDLWCHRCQVGAPATVHGD